MQINPFFWTDALKDGVRRDEFATKVAMWLKGGTHIAVFGLRGTGKTTFLNQLVGEMSLDHGPKAPPWEMIIVDLRRAISLQAFVGAIVAALQKHPSRRIQRRARTVSSSLEKQLGISLGVVKAGIRSPAARANSDAEVLYAHLATLAEVADRIVIAFDEFQRLASCPGEPLSIIRSALMGTDRAERVSLVLTGSLRERLQLMLHTSTEPIWDQTHDVELPDLDPVALIEYIEDRFNQTGRPITPDAAEHLVDLTNAHPKRTQHLAWYVWQTTRKKTPLNSDDIQDAFEDLLKPTSPYASDFERLFDTFLQGTETDVNNARALLMIAAGAHTGSDIDSDLYGFSNAAGTHRALKRLKERGLITKKPNSNWQIVDPLLAAWLKRQNPLTR